MMNDVDVLRVCYKARRLTHNMHLEIMRQLASSSIFGGDAKEAFALQVAELNKLQAEREAQKPVGLFSISCCFLYNKDLQAT